MIVPSGAVRVLVATRPVDFRKGADRVGPSCWRDHSFRLFKWSQRNTVRVQRESAICRGTEQEQISRKFRFNQLLNWYNDDARNGVRLGMTASGSKIAGIIAAALRQIGPPLNYSTLRRHTCKRLTRCISHLPSLLP